VQAVDLRFLFEEVVTMAQLDTHGHGEMQVAIDGLEQEVVQSNAALRGYRTSTFEAVSDLIRLVDEVKPLLLRAHAALMVDERNKPLLDELIEATLNLEDCRVKWEAVARGL
jgi:hypothetical protein